MFISERGKKKKLSPFLLAAGAKLVSLLPLFVGGLALLSVKAVIVSKIAFVLALFLVAKNFLGKGFGSGFGSGFGLFGKTQGTEYLGSSAPSWNSAGAYSGASYGNYRNFNFADDKTEQQTEEASGQDFAYSGHIKS